MSRGVYKRKSAIDRFNSLYEPITESGCWIWLGNTSHRYGYISVNGKRVRAHRFSYTHFVGEIKDNLVLDHICRVRECVNPNHLEAVTSQENRYRQSLSITHCPRGHEYNEENTYHYNGSRHCKICSVERTRVWRKKNG